jgi:hypothetical protein
MDARARVCACVQSSGSLHADLRALNVQKCAMCLVMDTTGLTEVDDVFVDLNAIRTTMQITSLCGIENNAISRQLDGTYSSSSFGVDRKLSLYRFLLPDSFNHIRFQMIDVN